MRLGEDGQERGVKLSVFRGGKVGGSDVAGAAVDYDARRYAFGGLAVFHLGGWNVRALNS